MQSISKTTKGEYFGSLTAHIDGDDIGHGRKGGQSRTDLGIKAGVLYLLRLPIINIALLASLALMETAVQKGRGVSKQT